MPHTAEFKAFAESGAFIGDPYMTRNQGLDNTEMPDQSVTPTMHCPAHCIVVTLEVVDGRQEDFHKAIAHNIEELRKDKRLYNIDLMQDPDVH